MIYEFQLWKWVCILLFKKHDYYLKFCPSVCLFCCYKTSANFFLYLDKLKQFFLRDPDPFFCGSADPGSALILTADPQHCL